MSMYYAEAALVAERPECQQEFIEWIRVVERVKRNYNKNVYSRSFDIGDWVYVLYPPELLNKLGRDWQGTSLILA